MVGTYTVLEVAGYPLWMTKSAVDPEAMAIFRESDKHVKKRVLSEGSDDEVETAIFYACPVGHVRARLDVMGFTMDRLHNEFEALRNDEKEKFASWAEEDGEDWFAGDRDFMATLAFDKYATAFRHIIEAGLLPHPFDDAERPGLDAVTKYILAENDDYWLGFLGTDIRSLIRLACELVDEKANVAQDITDLVQAGYYSADEPVCANAIASLTRNHPENASRIILTEGSTDREFLQGALQLLYPHLAEYYSFLEFEGTRLQGGAGHLASLVKAFAGAGITDRIIAVFDNDTAAREATRSLQDLGLPSNIAVLSYPDLDFLCSYPTLGPGGSSDLDVNGVAASLELYLGRDVLLRAGSLIPVQWKGYSEAVGRYQGEVMHKKIIHNAYRAKLARCKDSDAECENVDWSGMHAIWRRIFDAFR